MADAARQQEPAAGRGQGTTGVKVYTGLGLKDLPSSCESLPMACTPSHHISLKGMQSTYLCEPSAPSLTSRARTLVQRVQRGQLFHRDSTEMQRHAGLGRGANFRPSIDSSPPLAYRHLPIGTCLSALAYLDLPIGTCLSASVYRHRRIIKVSMTQAHQGAPLGKHWARYSATCI